MLLFKFAGPALFLASDLAWTLINVGLTWICVDRFGLTGGGIAFFGSYLFRGAITYPIAHRLTGFHWSPETFKTGVVFLLSISTAFVGLHALLMLWASGPLDDHQRLIFVARAARSRYE